MTLDTGQEPHPAMLRVLIANRDPYVRLGLWSALAGFPDIDVCGEADSIESAIREVGRLDPHVVLVELWMRGRDGGLGMRRLGDGGSRPRVIGTTARGLDEDALLALDHGAAGYLSHYAGPEDVAGAIRRVARGGVHFQIQL